jgi:hypothetical protein
MTFYIGIYISVMAEANDIGSVNSNVSITENQRLYGPDTFTYMVRSHGCYRPNEKVLLGDNVYMSLHAFQDEGLEYNPSYAREFCAGRITTHAGYKPIETIDTEYFQMLFCRTEKDRHPCYVHCCTTNERVYDFIDGDLLLSELLYLVNFHARSYGAYYIDLNLLTCNSPCSNDPITRSRILTNRKEYTGPRITARHKRFTNTRKCSQLKRPATLASVPFSNGLKPYYPMVGDRLWDKQMGQYVLVTAENKRRLPKSCVFVGSLDVGSFVKYYMGEDQLFVVEEMAKGKDEFLLIRKTTDSTVFLYVDPKAVTPYRVVEMDEDVDHWFEYY